jgi:hypothetical protein
MKTVMAGSGEPFELMAGHRAGSGTRSFNTKDTKRTKVTKAILLSIRPFVSFVFSSEDSRRHRGPEAGFLMRLRVSGAHDHFVVKDSACRGTPTR